MAFLPRSKQVEGAQTGNSEAYSKNTISLVDLSRKERRFQSPFDRSSRSDSKAISSTVTGIETEPARPVRRRWRQDGPDRPNGSSILRPGRHVSTVQSGLVRAPSGG